MKIRYLIILLFFLLGSSIVRGSKYYCKVNVTGETGKGKVYASYDPALMEVPEYYDSYTTPTAPTFTSVDNKVFYLYAKPESGYNLVTWKKGNTEIGKTPYVCDNFPYLRYNVTGISSTSASSPTQVSFSATFSSTWVTLSNPYSTSVCNATINRPTNTQGTSVTLTATVPSGTNSIWVGWRDIHTGEIVSNSNPYTFKVQKKMDLEPLIKSSTFNIPDGFYCIKSAVSNSGGRALELISNEFCLQNVIGSVGSFNEDTAIPKAQTQLRNDLVLSDVSQATPAGSVMYLKYMGNDSYELFSQGVNLKKVTSGTHHGTNAGDADYEGCYLTITDKGNGIYGLKISISFSVESNSISITLNLKDKDNVLYTEKTDDDYNLWSIEPIATPIKTITTTTQEDIKYTTLRSDFSFVIPNGSSTKAYKVESISDGFATLVEYEQGDTIYAGVPSILTYPSSESLNIVPVGNPSFKKSLSNVVLYNNYGTHKHDTPHEDAAGVTVRDGGEPRGDGIGYFAKETYSGTLYRLSVNENNVVGFWTAVSNTKISGNEVFATQPCAFPKEVLLKDLPETVDQITYKVTNPLTVAYVDYDNNTIYAKDDNEADEQLPNDGEIDFMATHMPAGTYGENGNELTVSYGDHSNWVAVQDSRGVKDYRPNYKIEVTGKLIDATNRTIQGKVTMASGTDDFTPNTYCIANFFGQHQHNSKDENVFFATPQPNEIVQIIWAMWDGQNNCFSIPSSSGVRNDDRLDGLFANFNLYDNNQPKLVDQTVYNFLGLVRKERADASVLKNNPSEEYVIYPLRDLKIMDEVVTGVTTVQATGNVVSVKYYNAMGVESSVPFNGVNIVVTTYDNGTRSTSKVIR